MKNLIVTAAAAMALYSCSDKGLSREDALSAIQKHYPDTVVRSINCVDRSWIENVNKAGLVDSGLVEIRRENVDLLDPVILPTAKAGRYILNPGNPEQLDVYVAEIVPVAVTGIQKGADDGSQLVQYVVEYRNVSPFAPLAQVVAGSRDTLQSVFKRYDDGWRLEDVESQDLSE